MSLSIVRYLLVHLIVPIVALEIASPLKSTAWSAFDHEESKDETQVISDQACPVCQELQHSLWEISTRCNVPNSCVAASFQELATSQYRDSVWRCASEAQLISEMQIEDAWTIVFVHGNRTSPDLARFHARTLFESLKSRASIPIRLVSLSWPSEKPKPLMLPCHLVDEKKELIRSTGVQLAEFLGRAQPENIQAMVGFSFGCSVISCALHIQNGGETCDCTGSVESGGRQVGGLPLVAGDSLRVGFIAPAMDRCALQSNGEYNRALESVGHLVNLYNSRDPILRRFRFFDRDHPVAAGYAGLMDTKFQPLAKSTRLDQFDCRSIGASHALTDYCRCTAYEELLANVLGMTISASQLCPSTQPLLD